MVAECTQRGKENLHTPTGQSTDKKVFFHGRSIPGCRKNMRRKTGGKLVKTPVMAYNNTSAKMKRNADGILKTVTEEL